MNHSNPITPHLVPKRSVTVRDDRDREIQFVARPTPIWNFIVPVAAVLAFSVFLALAFKGWCAITPWVCSKLPTIPRF